MKAVLITQQGSGSNLLRSFLNSHPDIVFEGELFCLNREFNQFDKSGKPVDKFLDDFYDSHPDKKVVGFDLKYNQMSDEILKYLKDHKVQVMHLYRNTGRTFLRQVNEKNDTFTYKQLVEHVNYVKAKRKIIDESFRPVIKVRYEDMTRGEEIRYLSVKIVSYILTRLHVPYHDLVQSKLYINKELKIRY